jgi:FlaG protein
MSFALPPIGRSEHAAPPARTDGPSPAGAQAAVTRGKPAVEHIPSSPPAQVWGEMQDASRRFAELRARDRELHFEKNPDTGRVMVEVRDGNGTLIRVIPPSEALAVISGAPVE